MLIVQRARKVPLTPLTKFRSRSCVSFRKCPENFQPRSFEISKKSFCGVDVEFGVGVGVSVSVGDGVGVAVGAKLFGKSEFLAFLNRRKSIF